MLSRTCIPLACLILLLIASVGHCATPDQKPHGFVTVKNGHLYRDGQRIRLWGVNFCGDVKRQGNDLDLSFDRIKDVGFNAIRLNLFQRVFTSGEGRTESHTVPATVIGSNSEMDKLDRSVLLGKQRGMVFWFSFDHDNFLPGDYDVLPADGNRAQWVEAASKVYAGNLIYLDSRAEAVHKAYAKSILKHMNPYTGIRYADEPAIGMYELMNENAFVEEFVFGDLWKTLPQFIRRSVTKRWNEWLTRRYGSDAALRKAWGKVRPGESLKRRSVAFAPVQEDVQVREMQGYVKEYVSVDKKIGSYPSSRAQDVVRFACDLYDGYSKRFVKYIRSLGKPGIGISVVPITPTGRYGVNLPMYYAASKLDFVSNGLYGFACRPDEVDPKDPYYPWRSYLNTPPILFGQPVDLTRVANKPYLLYEANDYRPNPFRVEYPMLVATNAIWQDADGAFWYTWDDTGYLGTLSSDEDFANSRLPQPDANYPNAGLILANDEVMLAAIKSAGAMFLHGKLPGASKPQMAVLGKDLLFDISGSALGGQQQVLRSLAWHTGLRLQYEPDKPSRIPPPILTGGSTLDVGKNIHFDWTDRGFVRIDSPTVRAYTGFAGTDIRIGDTSLTGLNRRFISAGFVAEDGLPLSESRSVLMTLASDSRNTGQSFDVSLMKRALAPGLAEAMVDPGTAPVIVDRVSAVVTAPWMNGMTYEKYNFARGCYEMGKVDGSVQVNADEPLFYCRLRRPGKERTIKKILIMGNSLTHHGPSTDALGWQGDYGMAATARENDYAHQLYKLICDNQPGLKPELRVESLFESTVKDYKPSPDYKPELVVVQVGDNWPQDQVNMKDIGEPYGRALEKLRKNSDPLIVCVSDWSGRTELNSMMRQMALRYGGVFVDIWQLHSHENTAASEGHFTHPGVNWHPGDIGMEAIAETVWSAIKPKL